MKISSNFHLEELVSRGVWLKLGAKAILLIDNRLIISLEEVRALFGKRVTVNDWLWEGKDEHSGFRTQIEQQLESPNIEFGQHQYGRAADCDIDGITAEEARQYILKNQKKLTFVRRLEGKVSWLHMDLAYNPGVGITVF